MKKLWLLLFLLTLSFGSQARVYQVFGIDQEISLGLENENLAKNYYVNIGSNQGIQKGGTLNVFRNINKYNPYENKKRANYHVKIGELKIIHTEGEIAIAVLKELKTAEVDISVEVNSLMIGDQVMIKLNN
jgi:hypothetical protein